MTFYLTIYFIVIIIIAYLKRSKSSEDLLITNTSDKKAKPASRKMIKPETGISIIPSAPISEALKQLSFHFDVTTTDNGNIIYRFPVSTNQMKTNVIMVDNKTNDLISITIRNPVLIPEVKRSSVFEFIGMINYDYNKGTFEMDHRNGEIRLRSVIPLNNNHELSAESISHWINEVSRMMDLTFSGFIAVAYGSAIPSEIWYKIQNAVDPKLN